MSKMRFKVTFKFHCLFPRMILLALLCVTLFSATGLLHAEPETQRAPNVILLMSDDQGWGDVGFNGHPHIHTPHLDEMAANGVIFTRFYAAAPLCSPTRASVMTGRFPHRTGIMAAHTAGLRVGETTIAEALKSRGYRTGFFGKWHMGWVKPEQLSSRGFYSPPWHHGFDVSFATTSAVPTYDPTVTPEGWNQWGQKAGTPWKEGTAYVHDGEVVMDNLDGDDSRITMDRVIPFVEENQDRTFFAVIWFHAPHEPVVAGPEDRALYAEFDDLTQHYLGSLTAMDREIGRLRKVLRDLNLERDTVLFFCSDNGPSSSLERKGAASSGPFRGTKHKMYEGGLLVPACAEWPGVIEPGTVTEVRSSTVDYFPTVAQLAGFSFSKNQNRPIDGIDLMPVIQGEVTSRELPMYFGYRRLFTEIDGQAVIDGDYKLLKEAKANPSIRLYNLASDPYEENDLSEEYPEKFAEMLRQLQAIDEEAAASRDGRDYRY